MSVRISSSHGDKQVARWTAGTCRLCRLPIVTGDDIYRTNIDWIHQVCQDRRVNRRGRTTA